MEIFKLFGSIFVKNDEANQAMDTTEKKGEGLGNKLGSVFGGIGKAAVAGFAAMGAAMVGALVKGVADAGALEKALGSLQKQTGATSEEIDGFRDSILNVYASGMGESFDDIAGTMAEIKTITGETGKELENTTKNALAMRNTFDFDVKESMTAVDQLMKNFGVSSETAFNLIAQGAQNGANKNGDLMDIVKEYSVHFKQIGLDAEGMMNTLVAGADSGAFSMDKVGDAVKEFGIRTREGGDDINAVYTKMGLNAAEMTKAFGEGGKAGEDAFKKVLQGLSTIENPIEQNAAGVALFGTMWEDLGKDAVLALGDITNKVSDSKDALEGINKIKYNSFGEAMEGIGRQFQASFFVPLGEKVLPLLNEFANFIQANMPMVTGLLNSAFEKVGESMGSVTPLISGTFETLTQLIGFLIEIGGNLLPTIASAGMDIGGPLMTLAENILPVLAELVGFFVTDILPPVIELITGLIQNILPPLLELFNSLVTNVLPPLSEIFSKLLTEILPPLIEIFFNIIEAVLPPLAELLGNLASTILPPVLEAIKLVADMFGTFIGVIMPLIETILPLLSEKFSESLNTISTMASTVFEALGEIIGNAKDIFEGLIEFITGVFTGNWEQAWLGVQRIFGGIFENLVILVKTPFNAIIDMVNTLIDSINSISVDVPGIGEIGFNIPNIPRLKTGMAYVPYDYFPAFLDEGERVLTKEENREYTENKNSSTNLYITNFYNNRKEDVKELMEEAAFYASQVKKGKGDK